MTQDDATRAQMRADGDALSDDTPLFRTMFMKNPLPMWVYELDSLRFLLVNDAAVQKYGYAREQFLSMTIKDIRPAEDIPKVVAFIENELDHAARRSYWQHKKKDGTLIDVEIASQALTYQGRPARFVVAKDVTAQKRAENELRISRERLQTIVNSSPIILFALDENAVFTTSEGSSLSKVGLQPGQLVGNSAYDVYGDLVFENVDGEAIPGTEVIRRIYAGETLQVTSQLGDIIFENRLVPRIDGTGNVTGLIGVAIEVTERERFQQKLRETNEHLRAVIDSAPLAIAALTLDGTVTRWSPAAEAIFGWTAEEVVGGPYPLADTPELQRELQENLQRVAGGEVLRNVEMVRRHKDGRPIEVRIDAAPIYGSQSEPVGAVATIGDITAQKEAERRLRHQAFLLENVSEAIISTDLDFVIRSWNQAAEELYGWRADEVIGRQMYDVVPIDYLESERSQVLERFRKERQWSGETLQTCRDGSQRYILTSASILSDDQGHPVASVAVNRDITERKRMEDELRLRERDLRDAQRIARLGSWRLDLDRNELSWSDTVYEIFGVTQAKFSATYEAFFHFVHPDDRARMQKAQNAAIEGIAPLDLVHRIIRPDGEIRFVHERAEVSFDDQDKPFLLLGTVQDVTERRRARQALQAYANRLEVLHQIDREILVNRSTEEIAEIVVEHLAESVECELVGAGVLDERTRTIRVLASRVSGRDLFATGTTISVAGIDEKYLVRLRGGEFFYVPDLTQLETPDASIQRMIDVGLRSGLFLPLSITGQSHGLLGLASQQVNAFDSQAMALAREVAAHLSIALQQAYLRREERLQRATAEALRDTAVALSKENSLEPILETVLANIGRITKSEVQVYSEINSNEAQILLVKGRRAPEIMLQLDVAHTWPLPSAWLSDGNPEIIDDPEQQPAWVRSAGLSWIKSTLSLPVHLGQGLVGMITLVGSSADSFDPSLARQLEGFAEQLALAIDRVRLYEDLRSYAYELETRVADRTARLEEQYRRQAIQEERQRLARELHDAVSQALFSAHVTAEALPRVWKRNPDAVHSGLLQLQRLTKGAMAEMRTLLLELRPDRLKETPPGDLIGHLVDSVAARAQIDVTTHIADTPDRPLPPEVQETFFRIAQEGLNNVVRHANATEVYVELERPEKSGVRLTIRDNGVGFEKSTVPPDHLGLTIMKERAYNINAALTITSAPGAGTTVELFWKSKEKGANDSRE